MPINFVPRDAQRTAPRQGALRDAWNTALKAYGAKPGAMLSKFGEFEPGEIAQVESGRVELNANEIISAGVRLPSYTLEAPLRPFNVATGGAVEGALGAAWKFGKNIPVLGLAFNALEGVGSVLEASNKVARSVINYPLAEHLKNVAGKSDNYVSNVWGESLTAKEIRERASARWGVNAFTGEEFSLEELTARAMRNTMDFGEFDIHENGLVNFAGQALADPLNFALLGGGSAIGLTGRALKAASWARPAVDFGTRMAGAPRIGYGYMKSVGRVASETPLGSKMVDEFTSARRILEGQLVEHGTLSGALRASSWMMRGLYMPGYAGNIQRGMGPVRAGLVSYQRGGIQQMAATTAAEQVAGAANGLVVDAGLENSVVDGFTSWIYDTMEAINNDNIMSDNDAFMVGALFSPWGQALADIPRSIKQVRTRNGLPRYADDTLFNVKDEFRRSFGVKDDYDTIFTKIGQGDIAAGKAAWEWFVDHAEVMKVGNQLSNYTRQVADLDDLASRQRFLTQTAVEKVAFLREKRALMPNSLADYMIDMYRNGPVSVGGDTLAHQFEITADGFYQFVGRLHRMNSQFAPQFEKFAGLQVTQGAPITRELLDGILDDLAGVPDGIIPRDVAAQIMDAAPSLVWENEFWQRLSSTLGQRMPNGTFKRAVTPGENVPVSQIREKIMELRENAPPAAELFHESVASSKRATRIKPGETMLSEPPYKMPDKLGARRVYNTGRVKQLINADRTITAMRNAEFFKSGKPRLASAKTLAGDEGGVFRRTPAGTMRRDDGVEFSIENGVLKPTAIDGEVLRLGAKHGGKTVVARVDDGPLLAENGFVEVARISSPETPWADPGPRPELKTFEDDPARAEAAFDEWAAADEAWSEKLTEGVMTGKITLADAKARGLSIGFSWGDPVPLPPVMYHATGDVAGVMANGLKTRRELGRTALGGGPDNVISFTPNKATAERIAETLREVGQVLRGEISIDDLIAMAAKGGFKKQFEEAIAYQLDQLKYLDGPSDDRLFEIYSQFLRTQQASGGPIDPYFFAPNKEQLKNLSPDNIGVVEVRSKPGAMGGVAPHMEEIRTSANAVTIVGRKGGPKRAAYAYKGGDVTRIVENRPAFSPYKPSKKVVQSEDAAINRARKEADRASLLYPSMEAVAPSPTRMERTFSPEERLAELQRLQDLARGERKGLVKQISESDRIAMELSGINTNVANLGEWFNRASKREIDEVIQLIKDVNRDYPTMTVREGQQLWVDPRADRFSMLVNQRNLYRRMAFEYGHLSPISYLYNALLAPTHARFLGKQTQTEVHNLLAQSGFTAKESKKFITILRDEVISSRSAPGSVGEMSGGHLFRTVNALPEGKVRDALEAAAPGKSAEVLARFGEGQKMLTEAGHRILRNTARRGRAGGKVDPLMQAVNNAYRIWQYTPGLSTASSATRYFSKFLYPLLRFGADPLYHIMNIIEPDMYGLSMEGIKATRRGEGLVNRAQSANAAEQASLTSIPPGGLRSKELPVEFLLADSGAYTMPRHIRPILEKHFDASRLASTEDMWRAMSKEHPIAVMMREQFGDDVKDWAQAADEIMYGYMTRGPEATIMGEVKAVMDDMGITKEEAKMLAPFMERLASAHRGNYNDLVQLYIGRLNRSTLERTLDHFFLFWPLSYQIKATTWLARIMFQRIGGVNTGGGGAYLWDEYRQRWEQDAMGDPGFKDWAEENDQLMFLFEMMFPMTPQGIGVSLSRPARYVGSWMAQEIDIPDEYKEMLGEYPYIETLGDLVTNSLAVGPVRSERLWSSILDKFDVPLFDTDANDTPAVPPRLPS